MNRVLILGGTGDAAELAAKLSLMNGVEVITSLAGRTRQPAVPIGSVRVGGFGGTAGLTAYLHEHQIDILIDATHPFAAQISWNAAVAAKAVPIPHLLLVRPAWDKVAGDDWIEVETIAAAALAMPTQAKRILLTIGKQELAAFADLTHHWFLMRMIDPPIADAVLPPGAVVCDRGPFSLDNERTLLLQHNIGALVSKNSGGDATYAKIKAARELSIPVIMVQRPTMPASEQVATVEQVLSWLVRHLQ